MDARIFEVEEVGVLRLPHSSVDTLIFERILKGRIAGSCQPERHSHTTLRFARGTCPTDDPSNANFEVSEPHTDGEAEKITTSRAMVGCVEIVWMERGTIPMLIVR